MLQVLPVQLKAQIGNNDFIKWDKNYQLKWQDFEGNGDTSLTIGALSMLQISYYHKSLENNNLSILIETVFNKKQSIKNMEHMEAFGLADQILGHEQLHFDIEEVYARKFRKAIMDLSRRAKRKDSDWLLQKASKLYTEIQLECDQEQNLFDKENEYLDTPDAKENGSPSDSSIKYIDDMQQKWRNKVDMELKKLERYSNPNIILHVKRNTVM